MRLVITGCHMSGGEHVARLLTEAGIPTGFEEIIDRWSPGFDTCPPVPTGGPTVADVSYIAAPFVAAGTLDVPSIHLVRRPLASIADLVAEGRLDDPIPLPFVQFIDAHVGIRSVPAGYRRAAAYWVRWNELAAADAAATWRVDELDLDNLRDAAELARVELNEDRAAAALAGLARPDYYPPDARRPVTGYHLGDAYDTVNRLADELGLYLEDPE